MVVILERVGSSTFVIGGGAVCCSLEDGETGTEDELLYFSTCKSLCARDSFKFYCFSFSFKRSFILQLLDSIGIAVRRVALGVGLFVPLPVLVIVERGPASRFAPPTICHSSPPSPQLH